MPWVKEHGRDLRFHRSGSYDLDLFPGLHSVLVELSLRSFNVNSIDWSRPSGSGFMRHDQRGLLRLFERSGGATGRSASCENSSNVSHVLPVI